MELSYYLRVCGITAKDFSLYCRVPVTTVNGWLQLRSSVPEYASIILKKLLIRIDEVPADAINILIHDIEDNKHEKTKDG